MIDVGDVLPDNLCTIQITDDQGNDVTPDIAPAAAITLPDGTEATPLVSQLSTGIYRFSYVTTLPGLHAIRWTSALFDGTSAAYDSTFVVEPTPNLLLINEDEALTALRAQGKITADPDREYLRWLCEVATDAVERDTGRVLVRRTIVEEHDLSSAGQQVILDRFPAASITQVSVDGNTVDPGQYRLTPAGILRPYWGWIWFTWGVLAVTYVAGDVQPPPIARKVALNGVTRMWQSGQQIHPGFDAMNTDGAIYAAVGTLTPLEMGAYRALTVPATG